LYIFSKESEGIWTLLFTVEVLQLTTWTTPWILARRLKRQNIIFTYPIPVGGR
jgi:hypothetical protein